MSYFKDFNFVRAITLLSLLGACVLGWFDWKQHQELKELRPALERSQKVETLCQDLQTLAKQFTQLDRERQGDQFLALDSPDQYIRDIASKLQIGQTKIVRDSESAKNMKGVTDLQFRITPDQPKASFPRSRLSQFFSRLEGDSQRIRITNLRIDNVEAKIDPHEIPEDRWTFDVTLTSRQKDRAAPAGTN